MYIWINSKQSLFSHHISVVSSARTFDKKSYQSSFEMLERSGNTLGARGGMLVIHWAPSGRVTNYSMGLGVPMGQVLIPYSILIVNLFLFYFYFNVLTPHVGVESDTTSCICCNSKVTLTARLWGLIFIHLWHQLISIKSTLSGVHLEQSHWKSSQQYEYGLTWLWFSFKSTQVDPESSQQQH